MAIRESRGPTRVWDLRSPFGARELACFDEVSAVALSPSGRVVCVVDTAGEAVLARADGGATLQSLGGGRRAHELRFSGDGGRVLIRRFGKLAVFDVASGVQRGVVEFRAHLLAFDVSGERAFLLNHRRGAFVWDIATGALTEARAPEFRAERVQYDGGAQAWVALQRDGTYARWRSDGAGAREDGVILTPSGLTDVTRDRFVSPDLRRVAVVRSEPHEVLVYPVATELLHDALWAATDSLLTVAQREQALGESRERAEEGYARSVAELTRRRG